MSQKTISIITPCYNEEGNVLNLYNQVREVMVGIGKYDYEHIFIDNSLQATTPSPSSSTSPPKTPTSRSSSTPATSATSARPSTPSSPPAATL